MFWVSKVIFLSDIRVRHVLASKLLYIQIQVGIFNVNN